MKENGSITLVDNKGPNNMRDELRRSFQRSSEIHIAVAFVNSKGLSLILSEMAKVLGQRNSCIRVLTRISKDAFNEPAALRTLLDLCKDFKERCKVRTTRLIDELHEKMYIFGGRNFAAVFIGSSNLTEKALEREGEINVKITLSSSSDILKQSMDHFNEYWDDSDELTDERLDAYASFYEYVHSKRLDKHGKRLWSKVSDAVRKREARKAPEPLERKVWLDSVKGFLTDEAEEIIRQYANWGRFQYYSSGPNTYDKLDRNDILILADYNDRRLTANRVKSKTRTSRTPDGRHFVAYQKIRNSRSKKISRRLLSYMKSARMINQASDLRPSAARTVSGKKGKQFMKMLNISSRSG